MVRHLRVTLVKRSISCTAVLLDDDAPRTCEAVWSALPLGGAIYHAKYARNEVYTMLDPFARAEPGLENPTITPIPGDLCYFSFTAGHLPAGSYGYAPDEGAAGRQHVIDLALFYGRNNILLNGDVGFVPANVFGSVVEGLDEMARACNDVWRAGALDEELRFERA
jgi:hypothetical protein